MATRAKSQYRYQNGITNRHKAELLTHWGRVTHIWVNKLTIIGSDNGLSPDRRQAIIWTNADLLLNGFLETSSSEIGIKIWAFSFKKMHLQMSSVKWRPFCLGLNVLIKANMHPMKNKNTQDLRYRFYYKIKLLNSYISSTYAHLILDWCMRKLYSKTGWV